MADNVILTVMGADRPGLVAQLAAAVADHGGNWVESRLVRLGGQFAGVLRVEVSSADVEGLSNAVRDLEKAGLGSLWKVEEASAAASIRPHLVRMELIGTDRPGILKAISSALARHSVNIEELTTERRSAPMSGELLFEARALVHVPPATSLRALRGDLEKIAGDLMVDLLLAEATTSI
jgi:glycine cleavage system regulatory protein